ncbi:unnamed protein product [Mytilus coruscus]|uniref:Integrase catalytic domain-containing protein n=1 Tax=Mytilus coruscus TaxID=42192 RepID=A0A6J8D2D6_MYTCO|nr:unnamed protein product [Mytilus coruscus]
MPLELVNDNGGEFNSLLTKSLEAQNGYKHILITPYHPQSNGRSERFNQTLKSMLNKSVQENTQIWERYVPKCCFSYNTSKQNSTKYSPYCLMYWRNPVLPNEHLHGETTNTFQKYKEISDSEIEKAGNNMLQIQKQIAADVVQNVGNAQMKQKLNSDKRHNVVQNEFCTGDLVLLKNLKRKKTLGMQKWLGPYKIYDIPRLGTITLMDCSEKIIGKYRQNNVKKYYEPETMLVEDSLDKHDKDDEIEEDENEKNDEQDENNNELDNESIFLTQSTFQQSDATFDLEVDEIVSFPSPVLTLVMTLYVQVMDGQDVNVLEKNDVTVFMNIFRS